MKLSKMFYLTIGALAGITYIVACGGSGSSIADAIESALNVSYDNASSGLSATNVQTAIDEVASNSIASDTNLVGTWTGTQYYHGEATENATITFGADGTFSCSGGSADVTSAFSTGAGGLCGATYTWSIKGNTVLLTNTDDPDGYRVIKIDSLTSSNVGFFFALEIPSQSDFFYGSK